MAKTDPLFPDGQPDEAALAGMTPGRLLVELETREAALVDAKAGDDPAKKQAAAEALDRYRTFWRGVRAASRVDTAEPGVANPDTVRSTARAHKES